MSCRYTTTPLDNLVGPVPRPRSAWHKMYRQFVLALEFTGLILVVAQLATTGVSFIAFGLFVVMYVAVGLGITIGLHRLLVHDSYSTYPVVRYGLACLGSMSGQNYLFTWVADHRRHHKFADTDDDPHTPRTKSGKWGRLRGFLHSHIGWLWTASHTDERRFIPDLLADRVLCLINRLSPLLLVVGVVGVVGPGLIAMTIDPTWSTFAEGCIWGGLFRLFAVNNTTSAINSIGHSDLGNEESDLSRNSGLLAMISLGEGWHHNHHNAPWSADFSRRWWQLDPGYWVIRGMSVLGLAWNIKVASGIEDHAKGSTAHYVNPQGITRQ